MLLLLLLITVTAFGGEVLSLVRPAHMQLVRENALPVVVSADPTKVKELIVTVVKESFPVELAPAPFEVKELPAGATVDRKVLPVKPGKKFYCTHVKLDYGINEVRVVAVLKDNTTEEEARKVYLYHPLLIPYKYPPKEFQPRFFHTDEQESRCAACHDMSRPPKPKKNQPLEQLPPCVECHKPVNTKNAYKHAPSKFWLCVFCHTGEAGKLNRRFAGKTKYLAPEPVGDSCYECHEEKLEDLELMRFHHVPVLTGKCNICHNPHGSDERFFLRLPKWELCVSCHEDKAFRGHVVFTITGKPHPTRGVKDPRFPKKELSCSSCHNPHHSDYDFLLYEPFRELCASCHSAQ
ncbi:MAG: hypothetical protein GXO03_02510 [Aquificae bacterium]|nr:hypothetical protein [Aquificota bacterium]